MTLAPSLAAFLGTNCSTCSWISCSSSNSRYHSTTKIAGTPPPGKHSPPWLSNRSRPGRYRHPRPPPCGRLRMQDFSSPAYWNELYGGEYDSAQEAGRAEWHVGAEALIAPLERFLGPPKPREELAILNVGCGTSTLWESMYDHGWHNITNIDFSDSCIAQGLEGSPSNDRPGVQWLIMDACDLSFEDATFHAAVDKGTMDAIACSEAFDWFIPRMRRSIVRVLRPGGVWICVSFTPPDIALPLLECSEWKVEVERLESFWMYVGTKGRMT